MCSICVVYACIRHYPLWGRQTAQRVWGVSYAEPIPLMANLMANLSCSSPVTPVGPAIATSAAVSSRCSSWNPSSIVLTVADDIYRPPHAER